MAKTSVRDQALIIEFGAWERPFTQCRRVTVPLAEVRQVRPEPHPLAAACGMRIVGAEVFGVLKVGYWVMRTAARRLVCVRRGQAAVRVTVTPGYDARFDEILVSASPAVVAALAEVRT